MKYIVIKRLKKLRNKVCTPEVRDTQTRSHCNLNGSISLHRGNKFIRQAAARPNSPPSQPWRAYMRANIQNSAIQLTYCCHYTARNVSFQHANASRIFSGPPFSRFFFVFSISGNASMIISMEKCWEQFFLLVVINIL